jgi:hypothetical protein
MYGPALLSLSFFHARMELIDMREQMSMQAGNTQGGSITVPLTSFLTG